MKVMGILGGVASGKSFVAEQLERLGACRIAADGLGHQVLQEQDVKQALRRRWGEAVFDVRGEVDRAAVAARVFAPPPQGPPERAFLEQITHPRITALMRQRLNAAGGAPLVVLDAALLMEAGWDVLCDQIVFVEASPATRLQRARQRNWSEAQFMAREAAQWPLDEKRRRADWLIDNDGSREHTAAQVERLWRELNPLSPPSSPDGPTTGDVRSPDC